MSVAGVMTGIVRDGCLLAHPGARRKAGTAPGLAASEPLGAACRRPATARSAPSGQGRTGRFALGSGESAAVRGGAATPTGVSLTVAGHERR